MGRYRSQVGAALLAVAVSVTAPALAPIAGADDEAAPQLGSGCAADLAGVMTLLPDQTTYVVCRQASPAGLVWTAAPVPFPPNGTWLSYGPPITLHGQGMRNPNLTSGSWRATPRNPEATCRVTQTTVVGAGVLAEPQVTEGEKGQPLAVAMQPALFYVELSGDCLWAKKPF